MSAVKNPYQSNLNSHFHKLYSGNIALAYILFPPQFNSSFLLTSRPPTSAHTALESNQPCFHRNHCHGNADNASLQCRKNPKLTTQELSVQPAKDRATTKTLWGEETCMCVCVWLRKGVGGGVIRHALCVCVFVRVCMCVLVSWGSHILLMIKVQSSLGSACLCSAGWGCWGHLHHRPPILTCHIHLHSSLRRNE